MLCASPERQLFRLLPACSVRFPLASHQQLDRLNGFVSQISPDKPRRPVASGSRRHCKRLSILDMAKTNRGGRHAGDFLIRHTWRSSTTGLDASLAEGVASISIPVLAIVRTICTIDPDASRPSSAGCCGLPNGSETLNRGNKQQRCAIGQKPGGRTEVRSRPKMDMSVSWGPRSTTSRTLAAGVDRLRDCESPCRSGVHESMHSRTLQMVARQCHRTPDAWLTNGDRRRCLTSTVAVQAWCQVDPCGPIPHLPLVR